MSIPPVGMFMLMPGCVPPFAWAQSPGTTDPVGALERELVAKHGEAERVRMVRGLAQAAKFWRQDETRERRKGNGDTAARAWFVRESDAEDAVARDALFSPMEFAFESLDGHLLEIGRDFRCPSDLDVGPMWSFDETLAAYDPGAHVSDDLFANKLAFVILSRTQVAIRADRSSHRLGQ